MTCQTIHAGSIDDLARRLDRLRAQAERRPDDCRAALAHAEARADYEAARAADFKLRNALLQRQMRRLIDELRRKARQVEAFGALSRQSSRFKSGTPDASSTSARPATSGSSGHRLGGSDGRRRTDRARPRPAASVHDRPRRPRPAVCRSVPMTRPAGSAAAAAALTSALVEPVDSCHSRRRTTPLPTTRSMTCGGGKLMDAS